MGGGSLVRRRQDLGLHELHGLAAALGAAVPGLDAEDFGAAVLALESLAQLIGHVRNLRSYCFCCMGWSQQLISPSPPLVTIISVPHLPHSYRFPTWLATTPHPPKLRVIDAIAL